MIAGAFARLLNVANTCKRVYILLFWLFTTLLRRKLLKKRFPCDILIFNYEHTFFFEVTKMKASYKKLWKLLVDKDMSKADLHKASGLSSSTMTKLRRSEDVSMDALRKICVVLDCNIGDIVEFVSDEKET